MQIHFHRLRRTPGEVTRRERQGQKNPFFTGEFLFFVLPIYFSLVTDGDMGDIHGMARHSVVKERTNWLHHQSAIFMIP